MGIHVTIDENLVADAKFLTGLTSDTAAVEQILRRVMAGRRKHKDLLDLVGKIDFDENYDPKKLRS